MSKLVELHTLSGTVSINHTSKIICTTGGNWVNNGATNSDQEYKRHAEAHFALLMLCYSPAGTFCGNAMKAIEFRLPKINPS